MILFRINSYAGYANDSFYGVFVRMIPFNRLNNSVLEDKGVLLMEFGANKTPNGVVKEGVFGGTYFRDIYSGVAG